MPKNIFCMPYFVLDLLTLFHICYSNSGENLGKSSSDCLFCPNLAPKTDEKQNGVDCQGIWISIYQKLFCLPFFFLLVILFKVGALFHNCFSTSLNSLSLYYLISTLSQFLSPNIPSTRLV